MFKIQVQNYEFSDDKRRIMSIKYLFFALSLKVLMLLFEEKQSFFRLSFLFCNTIVTYMTFFYNTNEIFLHSEKT